MASVLVVDDHMEIRLIFSRSLRDAGYEVHGAKNGEEALSMLDTTRPDIILLDVFMPVMNGAEFLEHIRKSSLHGSTPVLLLSAVPDSPEVIYATKLGISKFMRKGDFSLAQLQQIIKDTLSSSESSTSPTQ